MSEQNKRELIDNWLNSAMVSDLLTFQEEHPNHAFIGPHVAQITKDYIDALRESLKEAVEALCYYQATLHCPGCGNNVTDSSRANDALASIKQRHGELK